jgi:hypothetical protein
VKPRLIRKFPLGRAAHVIVGFDSVYNISIIQKKSAGNACAATNISNFPRPLQARMRSEKVEHLSRICWSVLDVIIDTRGESFGRPEIVCIHALPELITTQVRWVGNNR